MSKNITRTDAIESGDLAVIWKTADGDFRAAPLSALVDYLNDNLTFPNSFYVQRAAPSATGFSVQINDSSRSTHLILTPSAGYATGTIVLPNVNNAIDQQVVLVNTTQQVTALTVSGNGAVAVTGAPTSLGAEDYFRLKYDAGTQTWFRVG